MRNRILLTLSALLIMAPLGFAQEQEKESVAEAARKAREKKKAAPPAKKTFTNDDLSASKSAESSPDAPKPAGDTPDEASAIKGEETPEQKWRKRFAEAREKLAAAEKELAILQRELSENRVQYYSDPQKTLEQEVFRSDINKKRTGIEDKQKEIAAIKQSIEDMERQMRAEGGHPGWARQ